MHCTLYQFSLLTVCRTILSEHLCKFRGKKESLVVVSRRVCNCSSIVINSGTGIHRCVRIVQAVEIGVEIAFFPFQMAFYYRPHFFRHLLVACPSDMRDQTIDKRLVVVVYSHVVSSARNATNVSVAINWQSPLHSARTHASFGVLRWMEKFLFYIYHLTRCVVAVMNS